MSAIKTAIRTTLEATKFSSYLPAVFKSDKSYFSTNTKSYKPNFSAFFSAFKKTNNAAYFKPFKPIEPTNKKAK